jgi:hypothetical protein
MSDRDRIIALERQCRELMRQVAHLPARWGEGGSGSGDEDDIRYVAIITAGSVPAGSPSEPGSSATTATPPTFTIKQMSAVAGTGAGGLPGIDGSYIEPDPAFPDNTHHVLLNPFPYAAYPGTYAVDLLEDVEVPEGAFVSLMWRITGYDLTGAENWITGTDQVLAHLAGLAPSWQDVSLFEGPPGPTGPQGPPGSGDTVVAGYAIDIEGAGAVTVHNDPTEWTGFAGSFQFFHHLAAASIRTDPAWKTVADYDDTKNQMWWHKSGSFFFETTTDYGGSATEPQFLVNWGAGNGGEWQWKSGINYDPAKDQILWNDNGTWKWEEANKITIKVPTSIELNLVGSTLEVKLNYDTLTVFGLAGAGGNMSDTVAVGECP